jgi:acetyl esterase/lipase
MRRLDLPLLATISLLGALAGGCGREPAKVQSTVSPSAAPTDEFAEARAAFKTRLRVHGPAPQDFDRRDPPDGVRLVHYKSGNLKLQGWISTAAEENLRRPAVVFLHGGFAFSVDDWRDAEPFAKAGFQLFMPMLRGENGNPGDYESFFGEVDDAIAAGEYVKSLPSVDGGNIFLAGHSVGAVLATLVAMLPSPYKEVSAIGGYLDMQKWIFEAPKSLVPYDSSSRREVHFRNPMDSISELRCPLTLYVEPGLSEIDKPFADEAQRLGKAFEYVVIPGNHQSIVASAVAKSIVRFQSGTKK